MLPASSEDNVTFDYADIFAARAVMIRVGETYVFAVLDDATGAFNHLLPYLQRITGPITVLQAREILAHLAAVALHINPRPRFHTWVDETGAIQITADVPEYLSVDPIPPSTLGALMEHVLGDLVSQLDSTGSLRAALRHAQLSFLFDNNGDFVNTAREAAHNPVLT